MKKMKVIKSRKKFSEGGSSTLRSSDGELVRFGYEDDDEYQKRVNADKAAQGRKKDVEFSGRTTTRKAVEDAIDATDDYNAGLKINQVKPPPAPVRNPSKTESKPSKTYSEYDDSEEPSTAGFSRTRLKQPSKPEKKPENKPEEKPPGRTAAGKTAEQEKEYNKKAEELAEKRKKSDEVPSVDKIKKEQEGTSEGTSTSEKLKSGLSDTAEKVLGAVGATAGTAALGRQAYKMAKAPLGFTGEAKRMASNVGQSLRNAVSGRKPSAAGEGAEAAAQATKSVGPSKMEKARATAQRGSQTKANKRDVKQPKPTEDELDIIRMGSDMKRGGKVGGASRRGDGAAIRGKTRGRMR